MRRLTGVRYKNETVMIGVVQEVDGIKWSGDIEGQHEPDAEFEAALKALTPFVPKICAPVLNAESFVEEATVTGISITYKQERPGYVIMAKVKVKGANGTLNVSTPLIVEPEEDGGEYEYREELFKALREVVEQAERYLEGARAQGDLFPADDDGGEGAPDRRKGRRGSKREQKQIDELAARRREKEIDRALLGVVKLDPQVLVDDRRAKPVIFSEAVYDSFDGYAYVDPESEREYAGIHRHVTEDKQVKWCGIATEGGVARFWYDIQPDVFNAASAGAPTLTGGVLDARVMRAWHAQHEGAEPAEEQEEQESQEAEAAEQTTAGV